MAPIEVRMILDRLNHKFQFKFKDRVAAANILGDSLKDRIKNKEEQKRVVVLGIPRAGIITADVIANKLSTSMFNIVIARKLTHPNNKEMALGAIMEDGSYYINSQLINNFHISDEYLENEKIEQIKEIKRRIQVYTNKQTLDFSTLLKDRTIILADDGAATGSTLIAVGRWIRQLERNVRLIIAIPIAPRPTVHLLEKECNAEVEVVIVPSSSSFHSVEQYHRKFDPVTDEQVIGVLKKRYS